LIKLLFSDPQKASNQSFGTRTSGRNMSRQRWSRHHPDGLRQLQARDERDETVRDVDGLLRQPRQFSDTCVIAIAIHRNLCLKVQFHKYLNCMHNVKTFPRFYRSFKRIKISVLFIRSGEVFGMAD